MLPQVGQKWIPLRDWMRFLKVADWWDQTYGHKAGALGSEYGRDVLVKTPSGGIDGRSGTTIYSATCTVCVLADTATAGQRLIHETSEEVVVYNLHELDVAGSVYEMTGLTSRGTRYVIGNPYPVIRGYLDGNLNAGSSATMSVWDGATLADSGRNVTVYDPGAITTGKKIASGVGLTACFTAGKWYLLTPYACEV